jgi:hypothetical protein
MGTFCRFIVATALVWFTIFLSSLGIMVFLQTFCLLAVALLNLFSCMEWAGRSGKLEPISLPKAKLCNAVSYAFFGMTIFAVIAAFLNVVAKIGVFL